MCSSPSNAWRIERRAVTPQRTVTARHSVTSPNPHPSHTTPPRCHAPFLLPRTLSTDDAAINYENVISARSVTGGEMTRCVNRRPRIAWRHVTTSLTERTRTQFGVNLAGYACSPTDVNTRMSWCKTHSHLPQTPRAPSRTHDLLLRVYDIINNHADK